VLNFCLLLFLLVFWLFSFYFSLFLLFVDLFLFYYDLFFFLTESVIQAPIARAWTNATAS